MQVVSASKGQIALCTDFAVFAIVGSPDDMFKRSEHEKETSFKLPFDFLFFSPLFYFPSP